jgi:PAS domain S-box-containing protein
VKEIQIDKKQSLEGKKNNYLSQKSNNNNVSAEITINEDSISSIKVVDLPRDPKTHKFLSKNILNQVEQRFKNLVSEQQSIRNTFSTLFENVTSAIIIMNNDRQIEKINSNFIKLTGYEEVDLEDNPHIANFFIKKDRKKVDLLLKNLESNEQAQNSEIITVQCLCKEGSSRYIELKCAKVSGQNQIMVLMNDITERKTYEQEILRRNKELTLLNSISRLIKQPKDLQQILNPALEKTKLLLGMEMGVIYLGNQFIKNLLPILTIGITEYNAKKLLDQNLPVIKQIKKEKKDLFLNPSNGFIWEIFGKNPRCRSMALLPLFIRQNTFGILALASRKLIEFDEEKKQILSAIGHQLAINIENAILFKELEEKSKEVETKNKELSSFVFTVSHDLKTPLIALHGYIGLFREEFQEIIDETGKEYLDRIFYNAEYMNKMINDLLKLSRAGRVVGSKRRFSTYKLAKEIYMCLYPQIQQKQIKFHITKSLPIIYGDRQRLQTVFENLISNAIKYSSEKRQPFIEIDCKDRKMFYEFTVRDNGIGIDPGDHQRIFEVFQKCSKKDDNSNGTGVGLTIVKKIVEHHGGTVWVESKLDKGAAFYFTLAKPSSK